MRLRGVGHAEMHRQAVVFALDAARLDQAADAECLAARRFVGEHLGGAEEEHEIALERVQHQGGGNAQRGQAGGDDRHAFMSGFHGT